MSYRSYFGGCAHRAVMFLFCAALAGCGGIGGADALGAFCPQTGPVIASGALVSPANGMTNVSPNVGQITYTTSSPDLQGPATLVTLTPAGGGPAIKQPDSVVTTNGVSSSVIPPLQRATTYAVTVTATPEVSPTCTGSVTAALGSFTTQ